MGSGRPLYILGALAVCAFGVTFAVRSLGPNSHPKSLSGGRIRASGTLIVRQTFLADLDNGTVVNNHKSDLWFEARTASLRYLTPTNGAMLGIVPEGKPGLAGCAVASLSPRKVDLVLLPPGTHVCVLTNEGRYCDVVIIEAAGPSPGQIKMSFTTWDRS